MSDDATDVQLFGARMPDWFRHIVAPPNDDEVVTERFTLDIPRDDLEFLERFAAFRNVRARVGGLKLERQWSRKSLAESFLRAQLDIARSQLAGMVEACGEMPPKKDRAAMERYAKKVIAWSKAKPQK